MNRFGIRKQLRTVCVKATSIALRKVDIGQANASQSRLKTLSAFSMASVLSMSALAFQATANAAGIKRIDQSAFTPDAGLITFSEFGVGTVNPTYTPSQYGGGADAPTVQFGGAFQGQTVGLAPIPPGAAATGVVNGTPTATLALNPNSPNTFITGDGANPTSPVLSGSPIFNGPVSILFDKDIAGVGLDGGFFNAIGGTAISAFARNGSLLGSVLNAKTGIEFLGLVTEDGQNRIAGLQFSLVGAEPFGFAIDNLRFGRAGQVVPPNDVPEPLTILGTLTAAGFGVTLRRKQKQQQKATAKA
ncbi:MAG: PEP-CTERM sorting domain-containing protein [Aulosira sp. ZfuVER01]|nr:PEP-CTERM sorting domain-containing protein [Aulosira sp. ZfuVER01]MDZ8001110.1 PEP-CTERM sorting domain-containing protein [Aulosira sp. DedVER01a]MDZ8053186.1 PEP-CTERM sorting domain-containing protein [Aulosira sp. ZfuCHP01]